MPNDTNTPLSEIEKLALIFPTQSEARKNALLKNNPDRKEIAIACGISPQAVSEWFIKGWVPLAKVVPVFDSAKNYATPNGEKINFEKLARESYAATKLFSKNNTECHHTGKESEGINFLTRKTDVTQTRE